MDSNLTFFLLKGCVAEINNYFILLKFLKLWTPACAKFIDYAVKIRTKHKRLWKRFILNEEFIEI